MIWSSIQMFDDSNNDLPATSPRGMRALAEFRRTESMNGAFFARIGGDHEDADDASTWGPESPAAVDWSGFPA